MDNPIITLELPLASINLILEGLYNLPYKHAQPIVTDVQHQATEQLKKKKLPEPANDD